MLHKVSQLCTKIQALNVMAEYLYHAKYEAKIEKVHIDNMIASIRAECLLIANDTQEYVNDSEKDINSGKIDLS